MVEGGQATERTESAAASAADQRAVLGRERDQLRKCAGHGEPFGVPGEDARDHAIDQNLGDAAAETTAREVEHRLVLGRLGGDQGLCQRPQPRQERQAGAEQKSLRFRWQRPQPSGSPHEAGGRHAVGRLQPVPEVEAFDQCGRRRRTIEKTVRSPLDQAAIQCLGADVAPRAVACFEDHNLGLLGQMVRGGEPGDTSAKHRDLHTVRENCCSRAGCCR